MLKKVMKRVSVLVILFILCFGVVCASDDWGSYNITEEDYSNSGEEYEEYDSGNKEASKEIIENLSSSTEEENNSLEVGRDYKDVTENSGETKKEIDFENFDIIDGKIKYTWEFYGALIVALIFILIIGFILYSLIKEPKNKWKK